MREGGREGGREEGREGGRGAREGRGREGESEGSVVATCIVSVVRQYRNNWASGSEPT